MAAPPSVLREFCPLYYLLNAIPAKVQRGFRSVLVYLTAVDSSGDFLALGSSIGMLYLYCRRRAHLNRYSLEGKSDAITAVKLLSCFDDLVAVGTASGRVAVFQLVSPLPGRNKQLRRLDVVGLHKGSVTALAWSSNGTKLFSGDDKGRVVFSSLDLDQGVCKPVLLLEECSAVVQMEYRHQVLLISTLHRSLLYCTQTQDVLQLGTKPRKSSGRFGACFLPALCKQSDLQVFAARPGLRLWRSDVRGQVEETRLLKPLFNTQGVRGLPETRVRQGVRGLPETLRPVSTMVFKVSDISIRLSSPLATPTVLPPNGSVEMAQPIRTMAIIVEGGGREEGGGHGERWSKDGDKETEEDGVEEAEEQLELMEQPSRSRSSSVSSWDSLHSNATSCELRRYSAPLSPGGEMQELVVKAIRVKKRRRRQDSSSRLSESSCSDSMFVVQDGSCSDGGTPLSDRGSLVSQDLQNSAEPIQDPNSAEPSQDLVSGSLFSQDHQNSAEPSQDPATDLHSGPLPPPGSLPLQVLQTQRDPGLEMEAVPPTPDVDLLLECSFSYLHNKEEPMVEQQEVPRPLIGPEHELLRPLIGPEEEVMIQHTRIYHEYIINIPSIYDLSESWMGFSGPGCGVLSLQVTDRHVWCLDFKGGLFCSSLPETGLNWQRFEDNVHQVALSPSGNLLWKVEQKSMTAFACAKVSGKGKRHWYKAVEQTAFVALSDNSAWIIRTNGDLYLQTGLSVERPCARSVKVDSPCVFSQVCVRGGVVWALSEHRALFYREGLNSFCREGEGWKYDTVSEAQGLDLVCVGLAAGGTGWALDTSGSLWFRTGVCPSRPQGDDDHWWQISISDYVVFDQGSLFQTLLQATQSVATVTRAPVERVVAFLSQHSQCQPSLVSANSSGVWVASGRNQLHLARGSLVGTFWQNVVPRGTVSATRWTFITSSAVPHREGTFLWLAQSRKDLFCVWDQDGELRPSSVPLPVEMELIQLSACRDALWGLDTHGRVSIRTLSPSCPFGLHWTPLDLSQLGTYLTHSPGHGRVQTIHTYIMYIYLINVCVPGLAVSQLVLSSRTVWVRCANGEVARRYGVSDRNPAGDYWKKIPGNTNWLTVTAEDELWAVTPIGGLSRRLTKVLPQAPCRPAPSGHALSADDGDDEWELI
ncbi:tectonin beta-propeller repeat-containing protein 2 [Etheostoma cragini]|uniref:tectonin beta-propeller repeat-containing protein 2 n=1 Tax=Etheostoma cragini TaxID=417921 RepID=UPI00155F17DE|nr:tectonin beta-propeller repeat-containing protein 2 [Etheostoma cragini]